VGGPEPASQLVLKPADGRASRGVSFHRSAGDLRAWLDVHPGEFDGYVVEERKRGREFSVESLIVRSGDSFHGVTAKTTVGAVETGHLHPAPLPSSERVRVVETATACIEALGIDRGLLHTEVILDDDGAAHIVETHLRGGGDMILDLVRSATGLDLVDLFVRDLIEGVERLPAPVVRRFASSQFVFPAESGVIAGWGRVDEARLLPGVETVNPLLEVGAAMSPDVRSSYGRSVGALAHAGDPRQAYARARAAALMVTPILERA
jgi:biotin carboxylase